MITVIQTNDGRLLITDKHTKKDLKAVIQEAREDMVEMDEHIDDILFGATDSYKRSYVLVSNAGLNVDEACRP